MKMTKQERDLTIALGNEIAKNRKLSNMLNRVSRETFNLWNSGSEEYMDASYTISRAIDKDLTPFDCLEIRFDND